MTRPRPARVPSAAAVSVEFLAAAFRAIGEGVAISTLGARGGRLIFANDRLLALTGHAAASLLGRPHAWLHGDSRDLERFSRWLPTAGAGASLFGEGHLLRADHSSLNASWMFTVLRNTRGRPTHLVATYRDTTERRRRQEALIHTERLDAIGRLAGGVAHDFNNLLSVINGYCEMLAAQVADQPKALGQVQEIHRSGLRAAALTRQLLAFGRRQPMDLRVINLNRLVQENVEILARLVGHAGRIETDLAPDLGFVRADPTQFQQVLLNLVINARDALRDRGVITIATRCCEVAPGHNRRKTDLPPGRYVSLRVSDNGTGMDADTQKHLFEPFYTTKPEGKGTGLGLALVHGVVQQSEGFISVHSTLLVGSTFEILLPEVKAPKEIAAPDPKLAPLPSTRGHETILLIETDTVVRKMVAGLLHTDGYQMLDAANAQDAARWARAGAPPVHLLIGQPDGRDGALFRRLLAKNPQLRLLRVTTDEAARPLRDLPPQHQAPLMKPFALSEILRLSRSLLDAKH